MNIRSYPSVRARREALESERAISLTHIGSYSLDEAVASTKNCENMIGAVQIPIGIAGPLALKHVQSDDTHDIAHYFLPLATTEGALVASVSRGCKAILESGHAVVDSDHAGPTRAAVFETGSITRGRALLRFLEEKKNEIVSVAASTSKHLSLTSWKTSIVGSSVYVRFVFDTEEAMGLNMVTIATDAIASYLEAHAHVRCLSISGNYCTDKKPSWINSIEGRGYRVRAEAVISKDIVLSLLKTTPEALYKTWLSKCMIGSAIAGSMGFNAQYANVVAAMFLATGQDPAHVVEGSAGITTVELLNDTANNTVKEGIYISVTLPSILVGTVGGGTGLATQKESLSILGFGDEMKKGSARLLAEIIGGAVLAGELSLLSSLSAGTLAQSHKTLARGRNI